MKCLTLCEVFTANLVRPIQVFKATHICLTLCSPYNDALCRPSREFEDQSYIRAIRIGQKDNISRAVLRHRMSMRRSSS